MKRHLNMHFVSIFTFLLLLSSCLSSTNNMAWLSIANPLESISSLIGQMEGLVRYSRISNLKIRLQPIPQTDYNNWSITIERLTLW